MRELKIRSSYRLPFVMDLVFGVLNLLIYFFISKMFGVHSPASLGGAPDYFAFVFVGIVLTTVVAAASSEVSRTMRQEQLAGTLEALLTQPLRSDQTAFGFAAMPILFGIFRCGVYLVLGTLWLGLDSGNANWVGFAAVMVATGWAMVGVGVLACAAVLVLKQGEVLAVIVAYAMGLLGGAWFTTAVLPDRLQTASRLVPTRYAFDGARRTLFTGEGWAGDVGILLAFGAVLLPVSLLAFRSALEHARRAGSLGQY